MQSRNWEVRRIGVECRVGIGRLGALMRNAEWELGG